MYNKNIVYCRYLEWTEHLRAQYSKNTHVDLLLCFPSSIQIHTTYSVRVLCRYTVYAAAGCVS